MPITHLKVSSKSDGTDSSLIQPSDWNDEHVGGDLRATVDLSATQIRTLHSTPVQIIAAPGSGKVLWLKEWLLKYTFVTTAYNSQHLQLRYTGSATFNVHVEEGLFLNSPVSRIMTQPLAAYYADDVDAENRALETFVTSDPGSAGDGTLRFIIDYEIVTL